MPLEGRSGLYQKKNKWAKWAALLWKWAQRARRTVFSISCIEGKKWGYLIPNSFSSAPSFVIPCLSALIVFISSRLLLFRIQEATVSCSRHLIKWSLKLPLLSLSPHRSQLLIRSRFINPVSCTCSRLPPASANIRAVAPPSKLGCKRCCLIMRIIWDYERWSHFRSRPKNPLFAVWIRLFLKSDSNLSIWIRP